MLVTVRHNGQRVDAVAHAGKTGFLYVFNRVTGEPLWPIEELPVPKSEIPGEQAWPTQPFPTKPAPFAKQTFTVDDVNPWLLTPEEYQKMRDRVAKARNEGMFTPPGFTDTISMPGNQGGSNFGTTAADPQKGMVFVVNVNQVALLKLEDVTRRAAGRGEGGAYGGAAQQGAIDLPVQLPVVPWRQPDGRGRRRAVARRRHQSDERRRDSCGDYRAAAASCAPCPTCRRPTCRT